MFHGFHPSVHIKWHTCQSATWEEMIIVTDGAHIQLGAFFHFYFFPPKFFHLLEFVLFFFFFFLTFYSVFLSFPHRLLTARGHCTHLDVSNRDFIDRISDTDT